MVFFKKLELFFSDSNLVIGWLAGVVLLSLFYLFLYLRFRSGGVVSDIPREAPPRDLSPAAARYLWLEGFDSDCLIAGILSAVIKSCYSIIWRKDSFSIVLQNAELGRVLSGDERAALSFNNRQMLERLSISKHKNRFTNRAEGRMRIYLKKHYGSFLVNKWLFVGIGAAISLLFICLNIMLFDPQYYVEQLVYNLVLVPMLAAGILGGKFALQTQNYVGLVLPVVFGLLAVISMTFMELSINRLFLIIPLPYLLIHIAAFRYLPGYTPEGRKFRIELDEFRNYLADKFQKHPALEETETYLLPYLVALEVQFVKNEYFSNLLTGVKGQKEMDFFLRPFK
jgi:hypothetical protein